jgi:hypothetical protein
VIPVEIEQYVESDGDRVNVVPRIIGETEIARRVKRPGKRPSGRLEPLDRETLVAKIGDYNEAAGDAARAILDWADSEARVTTRYTGTSGVIDADAGALLKLWADRRWIARAELHIETLIRHGEPWNDEQHIARLLRNLADVGVEFEGNHRWPTAPLEPLADATRRQQFFNLMEETLDTLTGSP